MERDERREHCSAVGEKRKSDDNHRSLRAQSLFLRWFIGARSLTGEFLASWSALFDIAHPIAHPSVCIRRSRIAQGDVSRPRGPGWCKHNEKSLTCGWWLTTENGKWTARQYKYPGFPTDTTASRDTRNYILPTRCLQKMSRTPTPLSPNTQAHPRISKVLDRHRHIPVALVQPGHSPCGSLLPQWNNHLHRVVNFLLAGR